MVLLSALIATSVILPSADIFKEGRALISAAKPKTIAPATKWLLGSDKDPRIQVAASQMSRLGWKPDDRLAQQAQQLAKDIEARPLSGPDDPRIKRIQEITAKMTPPNDAAEMGHIKRRDAYDQETRRWVKASGYESIKQWSGRMVLVLEQPILGSSSGGRYEAVSIVDWTSPNRYWDSQSGRMLWTGGYKVRASVRAAGEDNPGLRKLWTMPERTIDRVGKNFSQMHLGREGWYIKFSPLGVDVDGMRVRVPLPCLSNLLLNGSLLNTIQTADSIGSQASDAQGAIIPGSLLLGYPSDLKARPQAGAVQGTLSGGGSYQVSWTFSPR